MNSLRNALWIELRKATRSNVPLFTLAGFQILPLACAFLMFVLKNPVFARQVGMVSAKANLTGGSADWPFYLNMYAQGIAVGGLIVFSIIQSWVFGREFADGTLKDMLAVPAPRGSILAAKFIVTALWSAGLAAAVYLTGLVLGAIIGLPLGSREVLLRGSLTLAVTTAIVIIDVFPIALVASLGRGYLAPIGAAALLVAAANIIALIGWGEYFPWSIPGLYSGMTGTLGAGLEPVSLWIVLLTGVAGAGGTYLWWKYADQNR